MGFVSKEEDLSITGPRSRYGVPVNNGKMLL